MSLELTRLYEETRTYRVSRSSNNFIVRREYRDLSVSSYKWNLEVSFVSVSDTVPEEKKKILFTCKNYTRSTNQRRFKDFKEENGFSDIELVKVVQFFLQKDKLVV